MEITEFPNVKAVIEAITKEDKDYIFVRHKLKRGQTIKLHYHNKANEWIVIDAGKFRVMLDAEEKIFDVKGQAIAIYLPQKQKHALWAISEISYFVLRDKEDTTIYCE